MTKSLKKTQQTNPSTLPAMMVAPAVLRSGKVHPLGVAELVAHEVQVALAAQAQDQQADHLVQRQAPVHRHGVVWSLVNASVPKPNLENWRK